ncbi:alpha,alpha-trehalose-phosphate synthase (UDP-forming) [Methylocystis suflitae]|uniref:alpha,alpha-trehalose-phosphate synthase (UDP-forming) n=1 Tax=Methylocystis suflitae TaxID=2951405 RepID=UPI00210969D6|nr:trehalose-6-phosphate synthase [Methylocystis suflitae]MCQ4190955.1 trehalose-6-phosphate synthase [Methylocystis suflitae]
MNRLVVASNRVVDPECGPGAGGLVVSVLEALRNREGLWLGWNGEIVASEEDLSISRQNFEGITLVVTPLTEADYNEYYLGFSNSSLWPVHHYRLDLAKFTQESAEGYRRVNDRFADMLHPLLKRTDLIWAHDYHLIPLGANLRERGVNNAIGFFLHIPFPPPDVLAAMPEHGWLIDALLQYDLVGFQTSVDQANFCRFVCEFLGGKMRSQDTLFAAGKTLNTGVFPVGIDVDAFISIATSPEAEVRIERLYRRGESRVNILGVDRLDYSKGLPDRLRAFKRFLELYPQHRKAATLMQIASPTREDVQAYIDIRRELEGLSGEINGEFGDFDWTPVRYIHRLVSRETLAALYRGSQVGLVTPLRDGMNLVAKEYVAAQDENDPGVLVLSRFAGAAEALEEALIVNPYDTDEVAQAIQRAITMSRDERMERHQALISRIRLGDAHSWSKKFIHALEACRCCTAA